MTSEPSLTRAQVREVDRLAIEEYRLAGLVLMENAGLLATLEILNLVAEREGPVAILVGGGNNGGDGYVIARQLACRGRGVRLYSTHEAGQLTGDGAANRAVVEAMGIDVEPIGEPAAIQAAARSWRDAALLVDALLGTGFRGQVRQPLAAVIEALNGVRSGDGVPLVAIDLPSGLDCDTGQPTNATVRADHTLTFVGRKRGFDAAGSEAWTGAVRVLPIGAPPQALRRAVEAAP